MLSENMFGMIMTSSFCSQYRLLTFSKAHIIRQWIGKEAEHGLTMTFAPPWSFKKTRKHLVEALTYSSDQIFNQR